MIEIDPDDLPGPLTSSWPGMVLRLTDAGGCSPQLAHYRANRHAINLQRKLRRPRRARKPAELRTYQGVPLVVRRAVRDRVAEVQRAQREARKARR